MSSVVREYMARKGLKIVWLAEQIDMKTKTLYRKIDGTRAFKNHELLKIDSVLGTNFGDKNDRRS